MTRLSLKRAKTASRLELGGGVWVDCRPLGQLHLDRAEANAKAAAREIARTAGRLADYGLDEVDAGDLFDLDEDADVTIGSGLLLYAVELAVLGVTAIGGVDDEAGRPLENADQIRRRDLALIFQERIPGAEVSYAAAFISKACRTAFLERAEGNAFAAGPNGASDRAASVTAAPSSGPPAPGADP